MFDVTANPSPDSADNVVPQPPAPPIPQNTAQVQSIASMPTAQPVQAQPSLWKSVLSGALSGLAGSAGSRSFGGGLASGAAGYAQKQQQDFQNQQVAAQNASVIRFRDIQSATNAANLANLDTQLHQHDALFQTQMQSAADAHVDFLKTHFGLDFSAIPNTAQAAHSYLEQASVNSPDGAHVPASTVVGPSTIYVPTGNNSSTQIYNAMRTVGDAIGLPVPSQTDFNRLSPAEQAKASARIQNASLGRDPNTGELIDASKLPSVIASYQSSLESYRQREDANPDVVRLMQKTVDSLGNQLDSHNRNETSQAVKKAQAEMPIKVATAKAEREGRGDSDPVVAAAPDGNIVMTRAQAETAGLFHYKADPAKINALVAGVNDVQVKINGLASIANSPAAGQIQTDVASSLLNDKGFELGAFGVHLPTGIFNAKAYESDLKQANQATRDFVVNYIGANEAITQLPRLQTFGQSSRVTEQQMLQARKQLPQPGDDAALMKQKMGALQDILDPLRKQVPKLPGATILPTWRDKQ